MATGTLISLDEYLSNLCDPDCEYVDGELIEPNMVNPTTRDCNRYRIPDITFTTRRIAGGILREPPLLCIEILSSEDRADWLETKIDNYLAFGVQHIQTLP